MGRALGLPSYVLAADLHEAVRSIDRVHGDGVLPLVPIFLRDGLSTRGTFGKRAGVPISILIRSDVRHRGFALVHEVGHLLDVAGLGTGSQFASAGESALVEPWKHAVERSAAVRRLRSLIDEVMDLLPGEERVRRLGARTLLEPEELWARSYAQYVAIVSGEPSLLSALDADRMPRPERVYYPIHWSDEDILPIAEAIEALFRRIGWRTNRLS